MRPYLDYVRRVPGSVCLVALFPAWLSAAVGNVQRFDEFLVGVIVESGMKRWLTFSACLRAGVSLGLILLLLTIAPFAVAQDVHHELAAADHDGHEHSDTDLCQWVQHHTAGSLDVGAPLLTACELVNLLALPADSVLLSFELSTPGPSRAPPLS